MIPSQLIRKYPLFHKPCVSRHYDNVSSAQQNKMDAYQGHPPDEHNETFTPETLQDLSHQITAFLQQEEASWQSLQADLEEQHNKFDRAGLLSGEKGELLGQFLGEVREKVEQKWRSTGCLAQVALKMIDYLAQERYQKELSCSRLEQTIEQLQEQNLCLSSRNINIENDVEYFRNRLEATEGQLENILTQESEEQEAPSEHPQSLRDRQIEQLEKELQTIREEIQRYKEAHQQREQHQPHRYMRMRSEHTFLPDAAHTLDQQLANCRRRIEALQADNIRLQRELDATHVKVRPRRSSRRSVDIKESKIIELIPEQPGEETERKPQDQGTEVVHKPETDQFAMQIEAIVPDICLQEGGLQECPSAFQIHKGNLLGDIKQSLQSNHSAMDASNKLICISSNRSLFANLELRDLVKEQSQYLQHRTSSRRFSTLNLHSSTVQQRVIIPQQKTVTNSCVGTEEKQKHERSTMTIKPRKEKPVLQRIMLKPVDILLRILWRGKWGLGLGG